MTKYKFILVIILCGLCLTGRAQHGDLDRSRLPEPVFSADPGYVDLYWKAWELAWDHVEEDEGMVSSPYMDEAWYDLKTGKDGRIWIWDTEFMALFCKYAPDVFPGIQSLDNFYAPMLDSEPSSQIIHHPDNPAFFPWVEWEYYKFTGNRSRIDTLINVKAYLPRYYDLFRNMKKGTRFPFSDQKVKLEYRDIGFVWGRDQSGMDNSPRKDKGSILWVDALGQQALAARYISLLAAEVGNKEVEKRFLKEYRRLCGLLNRYYWNKEDACYYDILEDTHVHTRILTPASFWPMLAGAHSRSRAKKMASFALAPRRLGGDRPWKSVSASDSAFVADGGQYWRGGIWLPTAYMGIKALEASGLQQMADETSAKLLRQMSAVYTNVEPHTIWECYDPSADRPALDKKGNLVRKDFCGWSALGPISLFIENIIGIREVDANERLVRWDILYDGVVGLKRLRFGDIETDLIYDNGVLRITANEPYTLILNGKKIHIKAGETAFHNVVSRRWHNAQQWQETSLKDIQPEGWLKQQLLTQKEGLTGHPEALSYPYNTCLWAGEIPRMGTHGQDWWRYEQTAYYTDGLLRLGYLIDDKDFINKGEAGISYTVAHPWENGRLGSKVISNTWPFAVFFRAMKAAYDVSPDPAILEALTNHYNSIPIKQLARKRDIISIEGMLWTAAQTGDKALVERADSVFRFRKELLEGVDIKRDDRVTPEFLMGEKPYNMHGVTMSEFLKLPIMLYAATGNPWYKLLAVSSLDRLYEEDGLPDGLFTSAEWLQGRGIRHSHETCNAIDMSWTLGYYLEILKETRYADMLEKIVFNAGAGSVTNDFKALQYYSSVNQFLATGTSNHNKDNYCSTWMAYRPTHQTECCAGNIHRLYPNYAARMWLRGEGEAVAALYGPSEFRFSDELCFVEETEYPYGETVVFRVKASKGKHSAKLTLRIPGWCNGASLKVNGKAWKEASAGTFVTIDRKWKDGDRVELSVPMQVERKVAFGGGIYFQRGPLVYSYAIPATFTKDTVSYSNMNGKYPADDEAFPCWDIQPSGPWNFALKADVEPIVVAQAPNQVGGDAVMPGTDRASALRVAVYPIEWDFDKGPNGELLTPDIPLAPAAIGPERQIDLVPYGSTTIRLTVFPVLSEE